MPAMKKQENLHPDRNAKVYQRESVNKSFYWNGDRLTSAGRASMNLELSFSGFSEDSKIQLKNLIIDFIDLNLYSKTGYWSFIQNLNTALKKTTPKLFDVKWLAMAMEGGSLHGDTRKLFRLMEFIGHRIPDLIDGKILYVLNGFRARKRAGSNVLSDNPELSKLTNAEYSSLVWEIWNNFDSEVSGPQVTLIKLMSCQFFRRPIQFSQLKIGDIFFDSDDNISGICAPRIFFPGAKDKSSEGSFRGSKFEYHPIPDHFIDLIRLQIEDIKKLFEQFFGMRCDENVLKKLPLFTDIRQIKSSAKTLTTHFKIDPAENLGHELFHITPVKIGHIIAWLSNAPAQGIQSFMAVSPPISERTGKDIAVNATRMRHTGAFRYARRGVSRALLSYIMGHTNLKALDAYYKDPAEEARVLDEAMKGSLTQLHMAFTGKLLGKNEKLKIIKESPDSILEHHAGHKLSPVGNCGKHSFCSTQTIPIPCYRCNSFQPFVDANHRQVLEALLSRQEQENQIIHLGSSKHLLNPIDLSADIDCVLNVMAQCQAYFEAQKKDGND